MPLAHRSIGEGRGRHKLDAFDMHREGKDSHFKLCSPTFEEVMTALMLQFEFEMFLMDLYEEWNAETHYDSLISFPYFYGRNKFEN